MKLLKNKIVAIFDLDGTLVNNEPVKGEALAETCRRHGGRSEGEIYKEVVGNRYEVVRNYFCENAQISIDDDAFDNTLKEVYLDLLKTEVDLTDGAGEFLDSLKMNHLKTGLVSSAQRWMVNSVLKRFSMDSVFDLKIVREDVQNHKPSPEAYLLALEKLKLEKNSVIVFEDSSSGLVAAQEAGCEVIAIRHAYNQHQDFSSALMEIESFKEIM